MTKMDFATLKVDHSEELILQKMKFTLEGSLNERIQYSMIGNISKLAKQYREITKRQASDSTLQVLFSPLKICNPQIKSVFLQLNYMS